MQIEFSTKKSGESRFHSFPSPGPFPKELADVPGFVNELTGYTLATSPCPNRVLAFAGALACLAHLAGRSCTDLHGTRTNLYLVVLGESGIGKDAPRKTNVRLLERVGFEASAEESFASGEAMEDKLYAMPCKLLQSDEVAAFFGRMRGRGAAARSLSERMRRLFTSSSSPAFVVRGKANDASVRTIAFPHLTVFGTGIPDEFLDTLTPGEIRDGLFGRCLILQAEDEYDVQSPTVGIPMPERVVRTAELLAKREMDAIASGVFARRTVGETPEAAEFLSGVRKESLDLRRRLSAADLPLARATVVRMDEKIAKLAMLYALSEDAESPVITKPAVEWALAFTTYVTKWMLFEGQFHTAEGSFGKLTEHAKAVISKHGGSIGRRDFFRALHCDEMTFKRVVKALLIAEEIEEPELVDGKIRYTLLK